MSESLLSRRLQLSSIGEASLNSTQTQVDGLVTRFVDEAADPKTLASLTAGGLAYRYGRIATLTLGNGYVAALPLRLLSLGFGLGTEVTAFEFTNRTFRNL